MRFHRSSRREAGFTLIEVLTVVVIIAILAAILLATFMRARAQSSVSASKANMRNIATALESYFIDEDAYPESLPALVPKYARSIPDEPCIKDPYTYTGFGMPPTDYKLSTLEYPLTNPCRLVVPGLSYTPGGGVVESP